MTQNNTVTNLHLTTTDAGDLDALARRAPATDDLLELADWLASNGAAHLSAIARIELAERLITRRRFLIGAGAVGLGMITSCGADEQAAAPTATVATRTVDSVYGRIKLPVDPQRVVTGYDYTTDYALVLNLPLVAAPGSGGAATQPFPAHQTAAYPEQLADLEKVQTFPEPNLEKIIALNPDCILDPSSVDDEQRYERLSAIAPTFVFQIYEKAEGLPYGRANFRGALRSVGAAFGRREEAEEIIARYEARAEELKGRLRERWAGATFAFLNPYGATLYVWGQESDQPSRIFFADLGLTPASFLTPSLQELSLEALADIDADVLFLALSPKEGSLERDQEQAESFVGSALWQQLPAVQKEQVYGFDAELYFPAPLTANATLDLVEQTLLR